MWVYHVSLLWLLRGSAGSWCGKQAENPESSLGRGLRHGSSLWAFAQFYKAGETKMGTIRASNIQPLFLSTRLLNYEAVFKWENKKLSCKHLKIKQNVPQSHTVEQTKIRLHSPPGTAPLRTPRVSIKWSEGYIPRIRENQRWLRRNFAIMVSTLLWIREKW